MCILIRLRTSRCKHFTGVCLSKLLEASPSLEHLDLSGTALSCRDLAHLDPQIWSNSKIKSLDLSGCTLTPAAVDRTIQPLAGSLRHLAMTRWSKSTGPVLLNEVRQGHSLSIIVILVCMKFSVVSTFLHICKTSESSPNQNRHIGYCMPVDGLPSNIRKCSRRPQYFFFGFCLPVIACHVTECR